MRNVKIALMAVMAAGMLMAGAAYADGDQGPQNAPRDGKMQAKHDEFFKDLGLTDEQKKSLEDNRSKNRKAMQAMAQTMRDKMAQMHQELQKDNLDTGKVNQIQGELKTLQSQMMDQRLAGILEVRKILTPDQFKKFSQKMEDKRKHWGHGDGKHFPDHDADHPQGGPDDKDDH